MLDTPQEKVDAMLLAAVPNAHCVDAHSVQ